MWLVSTNAALLSPLPSLHAASPVAAESLSRHAVSSRCPRPVSPGVLEQAFRRNGWSQAACLALGTATALGAARRPRHSKLRWAPARITKVRLAAEGTEERDEDFGIKAFPFSAVVGQEEMKLALLLNLVDPIIGGVMIQGERGTGKSSAVRALARLLPDIPCVEGDRYNSDPQDSSSMSDEVRERALAGEDLPMVMRRTPFVELPLGATEDRVTGTIDIERALIEGGKAFEPGILARVNRGILYIDEVNLLDDQLVDVLLDSAAGGWNTVEREGVSVRHPARFVLIGTAHPDEGDLRPQLLDRFGMTVGVRTMNEPQSRLEVLLRNSAWSSTPEEVEKRYASDDAALKAQVLEARSRLKSVNMERELKVKVSTMCSKLNVDGLRGDIVTNRAARALAAFEGREEVTEDDVRRIAVSCLQHRLRQNVVSDTLDNSSRIIEELNRLFPVPAPIESEPVAA